MPLRFYFDTHIAKAVADQLRASSIDVIRCEEINMEGAKDADHLMYATRETRIMISQDEDFTILHSHWQKAGRKHAGIMKVPANWQGAVQITLLIAALRFYYEAEALGAVDYESEIASHIIYL